MRMPLGWIDERSNITLTRIDGVHQLQAFIRDCGILMCTYFLLSHWPFQGSALESESHSD